MIFPPRAILMGSYFRILPSTLEASGVLESTESQVESSVWRQ